MMYEKEVMRLIINIGRLNLSTREIKRRYHHYEGMYEAAIMESGALPEKIRSLYICRTAYSRVLNDRLNSMGFDTDKT